MFQKVVASSVTFAKAPSRSDHMCGTASLDTKCILASGSAWLAGGDG